MKNKTLLLIILFYTIPQAKGQDFQFVVPDYYWNRTKSISQFMERFNRHDIPPMMDSSDNNLPYLQVISCFCIDSVYDRKEEVIAFACKMVDSNITLDLHKPNFCCELDCKAMFKGRPTMVTLRLVIEQTKDSGYCWSIAQAKGEVLQIRPNRMSPAMHISPVDNDMEFIELFEVLNNQPRDLLNYTYSRWAVDETSTFMAFITSRLLIIESIKDMRYVFFAGGYEFNVKRVDRETNNNGWLICNFAKYDED